MNEKLLCGKYAAKPDEREFLRQMQTRENPYAREIARELGINEKRAARICEKWLNRGWYECGVNILAGWLEGDGLTAGRDEPGGVK